MNTPSTTSNRPAKPVKRSRLLLLLTLVALLGFAVGVWLGMSRSAICRANYERLTPGMTLAEVEEILGGPARDESTGTLLAQAIEKDKDAWLRSGYWSEEAWAEFHVRRFRRIASTVATIQKEVATEWLSDAAVITVVFDKANEPRVVRTGFLAVYRKPEGPWWKLRSWFNL